MPTVQPVRNAAAEIEMPSDTLGLTDLPELSDLLLGSGQARLRIAGSSMAPTLRPGDEIEAEPVRTDEIRVGDLVLFEQRGRLICHRLVTKSAMCRTRGDRGGGPGEWIRPEQILGRVSTIHRRPPWRALKESLRSALLPTAVRWLLRVQGLALYRVLIRPVVAPSLSFSLGIAEGSRWYRWQELGREPCVPALPPSSRPHLVLAKRRTKLAGWAFLIWRNPDWQSADAHVRIRYRGLGVERALAGVVSRLVGGQ